MPRSCIIRKGPDRKIRSVTTLSGRESELYDSLAGIATMANRGLRREVPQKDIHPGFQKMVRGLDKGHAPEPGSHE